MLAQWQLNKEAKDLDGSIVLRQKDGAFVEAEFMVAGELEGVKYKAK